MASKNAAIIYGIICGLLICERGKSYMYITTTESLGILVEESRMFPKTNLFNKEPL